MPWTGACKKFTLLLRIPVMELARSIMAEVVRASSTATVLVTVSMRPASFTGSVSVPPSTAALRMERIQFCWRLIRPKSPSGRV